jgi:hypothetical protein
MKILSIINNEFVEILWVDDSEIELIPIQEFIDIHGVEKLEAFKNKA